MSKRLIIILVSAFVCLGVVGACLMFKKDEPKKKNELPIAEKEEKEPEKDEKKEEKEPEKEEDKKPETAVEKVKVAFNTDGGNKIAALEVKKGGTLKLPTPTKDGYKFLGWYSGTKKIDNSYKFSKNVTLTAKWEKYNYKCESGWSLVGTNCVKEVASTYTCDPAKQYKENANICVTINYKSRIDAVKECGTKTVHVGGGHTEEAKGEMVWAGTTFCYYGVVSDSSEQASKETCNSRGHVWSNQLNKCYYDSDQNTINTCSSEDYIYISNPNDYEGVNGLNGGCYPKFTKEHKCPDGYKLKITRTRTGQRKYTCISTIAATKY